MPGVSPLLLPLSGRRHSARRPTRRSPGLLTAAAWACSGGVGRFTRSRPVLPPSGITAIRAGLCRFCSVADPLGPPPCGGPPGRGRGDFPQRALGPPSAALGLPPQTTFKKSKIKKFLFFDIIILVIL